jgi:hypothetical protein
VIGAAQILEILAGARAENIPTVFAGVLKGPELPVAPADDKS